VLEDRLQQAEDVIQSKAGTEHVVRLEIALDAKAEKGTVGASVGASVDHGKEYATRYCMSSEKQ